MYNPLDFLDFLANGGSIFNIRGEVVGRDEFKSNSRSIIVDTCFTNDTDRYETAIKVDDDPLIVVDEYYTEADAKQGHEHWVEHCSQEKFVLSSIQYPEVRVYE